MYLCEKFAIKISKKSKYILNLDENKEQIIKYGAINLFQTFSAILWIIISGLVFNVLYEVLIFSFVVAILRKYSGGVHASSPMGCIIIGTILSTLSGLTVNRILYLLPINMIILLSIFCFLFSFIVVYKKAPVDSIKKPITNIYVKRKFRKNSILTIIFLNIVVAALFILYGNYNKIFYIKTIECISLGLLWQSITLTKILHIFFSNKFHFRERRKSR